MQNFEVVVLGQGTRRPHLHPDRTFENGVSFHQQLKISTANPNR